MIVKVKTLKVDLSKVGFSDPEQIVDGTNGIILQNAMRSQGFPINSYDTVDLPGVNAVSPGIEIKSRGTSTDSMHTVGTMTYDDIINTRWEQTPFRKKLQQQWRVEISRNPFTGIIESAGKMVDLTPPSIQNRLKEAYESCRAQLIAQGGIFKGQTISSGQFGSLEHKPGKSGKCKSYAMRIPHAGMKKLLKEANSTFNSLFDM